MAARRCSYPSGMPLAVAKAWAMRTVFLIYNSRISIRIFFWPGGGLGVLGFAADPSDLSTIEVLSAKVVQLLRRELGSYAGCGDLVRLPDEGGPDLRLCFLTQLIVLDAEVYATLDRLVEDGHSVRGQNHHALEVLQLPQEDRNEGVVLQVVLGTSFEEDVCFVEQ